jgi:hypothetical protein
MLGIPFVTAAVVGVVGGVGAVGTFFAFHIAEKIGEELEPGDLVPMPPPYPPVPRFYYTKPQLLEKLKKRMEE